MRQWMLAPAVLASAALLLGGCGSGREGELPQSFNPVASSQATAIALFDPTNASSPVIPFPFDGLFSTSTPTLAVPGVAGTTLADINQIDGFSTTASIFTDIAAQNIDFTTVPANLLIIDKSTLSPLTYGVDYTITGENATATDPANALQVPISQQRTRLLISPLKPLKPSTTYLAVVLSGIKTTAGVNLTSSPAFQVCSSATPVSQQTGTAQQYSTAQQAELEQLRSQMIHPIVSGVSPLLSPGTSIVLAWSFTTESTTKVLGLVAQNATAGTIAVADTGVNTSSASIGGYGLAEVYAGVTTIPYYLNVAAGIHDSSPLSGYWKADATQPDLAAAYLGQAAGVCGAFAEGLTVNGVVLQPSASTTTCFPHLLASSASTQTVPVLVAVPTASSGQTQPVSGWPVVIFEHGITRNREDMLAVADGLAHAGFVTVAMDLPLHGVTNNTDPFYKNQLFTGTAAASLVAPGERTFDLDLENNSTGAPGPDGTTDPSGTWFINLQSLITSRDNLREGVADLIVLAKTVKAANTLGLGGTVPVDPTRVYFFGHSLGAIVGSTLLGVDSDIGAAVLASPGGGIAKLLEASPTFGPEITAGLATAGVTQGTDTFETFQRFTQTIVDAGDPVNFAAAASAGHAIEMIEVINDEVVPNSAPSTCPVALPSGITSTAQLVADCPATAAENVVIQAGYLSGTNPLVAAQGLTVEGPITPPVSTPATLATGSQLDYAVQFATGTHSSVLSPAGPGGATEFLAVTTEMQTEAATFLASGGLCLPIGGAACP